MIRRPPRSTLLTHAFPTRRSSDLASKYGIERYTDDLDAALKNKDDTLFFDAATTQARAGLLKKAMAAGKDVYCEKPTAETLAVAMDLVKAAKKYGVKHGVVQDKLFLPGLEKMKVLNDSGLRSEEGRVGKECVRTFKHRGSPN